MKKLLIVIMGVLLIGIPRNTVPVFSDEHVTFETINEELLDEIDFTYEDLNLSLPEVAAVERLQNDEIHFGLYEIDSYYQVYEGNEIGRHYYTMRQLEKVFDLDVTYESGSFNEIITGHFAGEFDIVPGLILTDERKDLFHFADYNVTADIYIYGNDYIDIDDVYDLDDVVIAKQTGMKIISDEYIEFLDDKGIDITLVEYPNIVDAIDDLGDSIDYIVHGRNIELIQLGLEFKDGEDFLNSYNLQLTSKIDDDLLHLMSAVDKAFRFGLRENSEKYASQMFYLFFDEQVYFTEEEKAFIEGTKESPIEVQTASEWIPYLYENEYGMLEGYAYDMFMTLTYNLNLDYEFEFDPELTWNEFLGDLGRNGNEIIYDVGMLDSVTSYEDEFAVYSYPIRSEELYVVGLTDTPLIQDLFDLHDKKVGIIPYYAATTYLETNLVFKNFYVYQNIDDMIAALESGEIEYFAVIKSEYEGLHFIQKHYDIAPKFTVREDFDVAIIFPAEGENTPMLQRLYNKAITLSDTSNVSEEYFDMQVDLSEVMEKNTFRIVMISITVAIIIVSLLTGYYLVKIREKVNLDELTRLKNRRSLFTNSNVYNFSYLYYFDFDNFKVINDTFGHEIGDKVLIHICSELKQHFAGDIYRLGGDEFVLLSNEKYDDKTIKDDRFKYSINNEDILITFSVGFIPINDYTQLTLDELIRYADFAMYEAKDKGRNRMQVVSEDIIKRYKEELLNQKTRFKDRG